MNKPILYGVVGVVALIIIVVFATRGGSGTPAGGSAPATAPSGSSSASLRDLFAAGKSQQCTFSSEAGGSRSAGTVYVGGGKMRGDFAAQASGGAATENHMIVSEGTAYVWGDQLPQGVKFSFANMTTASGNTSQAVDVNQQANYSCSGWSADSSKFTLPSNVTFVDVAAAAGASGGAGSEADCAQCDLIVGADAKAQCRGALRCQ